MLWLIVLVVMLRLRLGWGVVGSVLVATPGSVHGTFFELQLLIMPQHHIHIDSGQQAISNLGPASHIAACGPGYRDVLADRAAGGGHGLHCACRWGRWGLLLKRRFQTEAWQWVQVQNRAAYIGLACMHA